MQIKSVIIDNIHYIDFITFNISSLLLFSGFGQLKLGCVLYIRATYMPSNTVNIVFKNLYVIKYFEND